MGLEIPVAAAASSSAVNDLTLLAAIIICFASLFLIIGVVVFFFDLTQSRNAILRNYPLIGRLRGLFQHLGIFFRQYFFAMDREEMPFNRAQRTWVYDAAKGGSNIIPFGSTRDLRPPGTILFVNCAFPTLDEDAVPATAITFGEDCKHPYTTDSIFNISAMSYGAISKPAVRALSRGAAMAGCWINTGEGGMSPWHQEGKGDIVFQIGTAKYGVRDQRGRLDDKRLKAVASNRSVKMFELKLSQGAKPGKGGILPGKKVTREIARIRGIPAHKDSISPNRFPEIESVEDLLDFIDRVRRITGKPVGFKAVMGSIHWLEDLFSEIVRRGISSAPDFMTIDSADGGSGAAPMSLMDNVGLPVSESLPLVIDKLEEYGLRDRVKVIASGKLVTATEVAWALCAGADVVTSARGYMFSLGCIQALKCDKNTCPSGVATHNKRLQAGLNPADKAVRVASYTRSMCKEVGIIAHSCGVAHPRALNRMHARIVIPDGRTVGLDEFYGNFR